MRSLLCVPVATGLLVLSGCAAERDAFEPIEPGALARAEHADAKSGTVHCTADEGGNLHVRAPADARVTTSASEPNASDDASARIEVGSVDPNAYQMPRPSRPMSRSLGFIGDAPLTQGPNHGGRYSYGAHDDIIGPHRHGAVEGWWHGPVFGRRRFR